MNKTSITVEPGKQVIVITREFDAPRELVFKAHVDPELYVQWLGPRDLSMRLEVFEPRDGGRYRFIHSRDGNDFAFNGVYHEVTAPERIVGTFEFEWLPERGHVELSNTTFENLPGGRSRLTSRSVFFSVMDRDMAAESGMETGVVEGYQRLDEVLEKLAEKA